MNWSNVADKIKDYAPAVATILTGGVPGAVMGAATMLAKTLGADTNPVSISNAIDKDKDAEYKIALLNFQLESKKLDVEVFKQETVDTQNARQANLQRESRDDHTARNLAYIITVAFFAMSFYFFWLSSTVHDHFDANETAIIKIIFNIISATFVAVYASYFGSKFINTK